MAILCSHSPTSQANLMLSSCSSSIFATKLTSGLGNSRNLLSSQLNVDLTGYATRTDSSPFCAGGFDCNGAFQMAINDLSTPSYKSLSWPIDRSLRFFKNRCSFSSIFSHVYNRVFFKLLATLSPIRRREKTRFSTKFFKTPTS